MKTKHTPGPWVFKKKAVYTEDFLLFTAWMTPRAKELNNDEDWNKGEESWLSYRTRTKEEREHEEEVRMANAKLIAAAPELLEICVKALIHLEEAGIEEGIQHDLKLAIKKATT